MLNKNKGEERMKILRREVEKMVELVMTNCGEEDTDINI